MFGGGDGCLPLRINRVLKTISRHRRTLWSSKRYSALQPRWQLHDVDETPGSRWVMLPLVTAPVFGECGRYYCCSSSQQSPFSGTYTCWQCNLVKGPPPNLFRLGAYGYQSYSLINLCRLIHLRYDYNINMVGLICLNNIHNSPLVSLI